MIAKINEVECEGAVSVDISRPFFRWGGIVSCDSKYMPHIMSMFTNRKLVEYEGIIFHQGERKYGKGKGFVVDLTIDRDPLRVTFKGVSKPEFESSE